MIEKDNVIVLDIDNTICNKKSKDVEYIDLTPKQDVLNKLNLYRKLGFHIILYTSRNMKTYDGNIGKICANTAIIILKWLSKYKIPYDEIHFGKPWCGKNGFYVDDKAIRPSEFLKLNYNQIMELLKKE